MRRQSMPRTVTTSPWLILLAGLAIVVGVIAIVSAALVGPGSKSPQDAIARIPVSTATPYPYATTSTPWKTHSASPTPSDPAPTTTGTPAPPASTSPTAVPSR